MFSIHYVGKVYLSDVIYAVVDEADSMFQEGFADEVFRILKPLTVCSLYFFLSYPDSIIRSLYVFFMLIN